MGGALSPKYSVIDDFLGDGLASAILNYAQRQEAAFRPMAICEHRQGPYPAGRSLLVNDEGLGPHRASFEAAVAASFPQLCAAASVPQFDLARIELQLCAFLDGDHFDLHIDTDRDDARDLLDTDRILTGVYYLSSQEHGFTGGELALHPFRRDAPPEMIAPRRDRLVVFPSFAMHEVLPVFGPCHFRDARLSVNCWLHRHRGDAQ